LTVPCRNMEVHWIKTKNLVGKEEFWILLMSEWWVIRQVVLIHQMSRKAAR